MGLSELRVNNVDSMNWWGIRSAAAQETWSGLALPLRNAPLFTCTCGLMPDDDRGLNVLLRNTALV
jgi:hypothetical protein